MAMILMAAYTNYRRDPRVKREAEAFVEMGHRVVFLAHRQSGEPDREVIAGAEIIKTVGLKEKCDTYWEYLLDYVIFFLMISLHLAARPFRYKLIHINNMPDFLVFATWLPRMLGCPVIHDVHDLMPELYGEKFSSGGRNRVIQALKAQERWAGGFASAVLTVEERLKDILSERGIPREKIHETKTSELDSHRRIKEDSDARGRIGGRNASLRRIPYQTDGRAKKARRECYRRIGRLYSLYAIAKHERKLERISPIQSRAFTIHGYAVDSSESTTKKSGYIDLYGKLLPNPPNPSKRSQSRLGADITTRSGPIRPSAI